MSGTQAEMKIPTLRQTHSSPNSLPHELLAYIFTFACPPIDFNQRAFCESDESDESDESEDYLHGASDSRSDRYPQPRNKYDLSHRYMPVTLNAVCGRWREVALSTPELWSTFALEVISWKLESQVPLLRFYLTNTGPLPFSLDLDLRVQQCAYAVIRRQRPLNEWKELQPLVDVIFHEFPEKIQTLRMAGAPPEWTCFLSRNRLPILQDLTFFWGRFGSGSTVAFEEDAFSVNPGEFLRLNKSIFTLQPAPGLPLLTTLHLRNVYTDICAKILRSCPHLVECHCYMPVLACAFIADPSLNAMVLTELRPVTIEEPFTLPNLKRFGWMALERGGWESALLNNIRLPNLEELQWLPEPGITTNREDAVSRFFSGLPSTLHSFTYYDYHLEFPEFPWEHVHNSRLLSHLSHVRSLIFHECSGDFLTSIFHLLSNRTPGMESTFLLPCLERITVRKYEEGEEDMGIALVEMLENRRLSLHIPRFTFEAVDTEIIWSCDAQDRLRKLTNEFSLTVLG